MLVGLIELDTYMYRGGTAADRSVPWLGRGKKGGPAWSRPRNRLSLEGGPDWQRHLVVVRSSGLCRVEWAY